MTRPPPSRRALRLLRPVVLLAVASLAACGASPGEDGGRSPSGDGVRGESPDPGAAPGEAGAGAPGGDEGLPDRPRVPERGHAWVIFGADTVVAEVARTPDERSRGLMHREELPDGTGMLFVFEESGIRSFWMENTYVALDIAFMDASFRVVDIQQMEPETTELHESARPALFALEVRQGWFAEHGVEVGDVAEIVFGR